MLHPDEAHDGEGGTESDLRYRMLYVYSAAIAEALDSGARADQLATWTSADLERETGMVRFELARGLAAVEGCRDGLVSPDR